MATTLWGQGLDSWGSGQDHRGQDPWGQDPQGLGQIFRPRVQGQVREAEVSKPERFVMVH